MNAFNKKAIRHMKAMQSVQKIYISEQMMQWNGSSDQGISILYPQKES